MLRRPLKRQARLRRLLWSPGTQRLPEQRFFSGFRPRGGQERVGRPLLAGHHEHVEFNLKRVGDADQPPDGCISLSGNDPEEMRPVDGGEVGKAVEAHLPPLGEGADVRAEQSPCFLRIHATTLGAIVDDSGIAYDTKLTFRRI